MKLETNEILDTLKGAQGALTEISDVKSICKYPSNGEATLIRRSSNVMFNLKSTSTSNKISRVIST
jgi:hypothetical protein